MYLKSIEIQGFKSFANKILFEFHNGITGIVGPNGSGKSNVADAVRWVLGEQRIKQLRGASMQDVIFAGTETRKPQGFASVAITLDNSDHQLAIAYDEVTVSRRIYRSGESEYRLNGSICRLKDIQELFYDTGIGKEGYSIIGQGQIDKILSGKPEERRELFDEAAGIVKFKRRKLIAQKKLEEEKQNLVRVNDILSELEKQVGPLKRQSETAREYLQRKEELKQYEVNLFLMESEEIRGQLKEISGKETIVTGDLEETRQASDQLKEQYDVLDTKLKELETQIENGRTGLNEADMLRGKLEGQINVLKEQIRTEQMNAEHIENRRQTIEQEIQEKRAQITEYETRHKEISDRAQESLKRQEEAEAAKNRMEAELLLVDQTMEKEKADVIQILNEKSALSVRGQRYETMLEQVQVRRSEVCQKLLKSKSDESVQEEQIKEEQKKLDQINEELDQSLLAQEEGESEALHMEQEVRNLRRMLSEKQQEYHKNHTRLESLQNLAERYDGYGNSIRRVMEVRDRIRGIHGVVADLITTKKQYETAIETALGGSIQNIVTDSDQTAKQLIEYLKKNKYGRATFLPLTSMNPKSGFHQEKALQEPGVLGLASDLVETGSMYQSLIRQLLGKVVVVDQIGHAIALAKKHQHSLRIVTLDGELLSPGGSMTGGAFKNSSNLLGRKREIEELEAGCQEILQAVEKIQKDLVLQESLLESKREELEEIKNRKQKAYLVQNTLQLNIRKLEDRIREIADSSSDMVLENRQLEEQLREIQASQKQLSAESEALETRNQQLHKSIETWGQKLEQIKQEREKRAGELSVIQLETANLQQQYQFIRENIRRVSEEIRKLSEEQQGLSQGTKNTQEIIDGKYREIENLKLEMETAGTKRADLELTLAEYTRQREQVSGQQKGLFEKRESLSGRAGELDRELLRLQNQMEKLEEKLENQINYMWSEYELTPVTAQALRKEDWTVLSEIRQKITGQKAAIRALGNVNVNAIEDYKEVSNRYEFMKTQHDDLILAEETLKKIIEELDQGMRRQFEEKFQEIRHEFDKVFRELFGGGHGVLELLEGEDILEAGIQIISQPPGKKLQNMMQLSGGEKALTAIALLFAIQNLKPSPFCLLDEIEAALDDSNVDRFAGYLHKLTKNTQFIIITHRRGTMMAADRLYGITMQEKGVSALVSVNLIEDTLEK